MSTLIERIAWAVRQQSGEFTVCDVAAKMGERYANIPPNKRLAAIMRKHHLARNVGEKIVEIGYSTSNMAVYVAEMGQ